MAETNQKVMDMVQKSIEKNEGVSTDELYEKAKKVDATIGKLTLRQFHARYPLQVKRKKAAAAGRKPRRRKTRRAARQNSGPDRTAIRASLVAFAREVSKAGEEGPAALIDAIQSVDRYVDEILKATAK